jgi:hypothetical protein
MRTPLLPWFILWVTIPIFIFFLFIMPAHASDGPFYQRGQEGWFWYQVIPEPEQPVDDRLADERDAYSCPAGDQPLAAKGDLSDRRYGRLKTELRRNDEKGGKTGMTVVTFCSRL